VANHRTLVWFIKEGRGNTVEHTSYGRPFANATEYSSGWHDHDRSPEGSLKSNAEFAKNRLGHLMWIGQPRSQALQHVYDQAVALSDSVSTRVSLEDAAGRIAVNPDLIVYCREDRFPVDQELAEAIAAAHVETAWLDVLGPLALGVRQRSCSIASSVPFHSLICELQRQWSYRIGGVIEVPPRSIVALAATESDAELYRQVIVDRGIAFFWATPSQASRFAHADLFWWDDSVSAPASAMDWTERLVSVDPSLVGKHIWVCHDANLQQERAALAGGIYRVVRKPFLLSSLIDAQVDAVVRSKSGQRAA